MLRNFKNAQNIHHLNLYKDGYIWSWTVTPFKGPRAVANGLTGKKMFFYVLLTVHLDVILVNDQLDALFFNVFISTPLHVSCSKCSSSGGPTFINTPSGITHSGSKRVCYTRWCINTSWPS